MRKESLTNRLIHFLASPKLAAMLIVIIGIMAAVFANRQEVFSTWWFLTPALLLFINTIACTGRQAIAVRRSNKVQHKGSAAAKYILPEEIPSEKYLTWANNVLSKKGFKTNNIEEKQVITVLGTKWRWAGWGSVIFHIGLILCMLGGLVSFSTGFKGYVGLSAKSLFDDRRGEYLYIVRKPFDPSGGSNRFSMYLNSIQVESNQAEGVWPKANVTLFQQNVNVLQGDIVPGTPLRFNHLSISTDSVGYYVNLRLTNSKGQQQNVKLGLDTNYDQTKNLTQFTSKFTLPDMQLAGELQLFPDFVERNGQYASKDYNMRNPVLFMTLVQTNGGLQQQLFKGLVPLDKPVTLNNGTILSFTGYSPWITLWIVYDYGFSLVYAGFVIAVIGLLLIYGFTGKQVHLTCEEVDGRFQVTVYAWKPRFARVFSLEVAASLDPERLLTSEG